MSKDSLNTNMNPSGAFLFRAAIQTVPLKLGQGYDVREDNAIDFNIFNQEPTDAISRVDIHKSEVRLVDDSSITNKFRALNIDKQLQLSVMLELTQAEEFGNFLIEEHGNSDQIVIHLVKVSKTEIEKVDAYEDRISNIVDQSCLRLPRMWSRASHMVAEPCTRLL